jgi:transcriptional regulator with XRE-family HTH domain
MANERLRNTIAAKGLNLQTVAEAVQVDPKTVERWIMTNRVPHRTHRWNTAKLLGTDEAYLWPAIVDDGRTKLASEAEFVSLYPRRSAVPREHWLSLVDDAEDSLDVLAFAGLFLPDGHPDFARALAEKGAAGTSIRILLGEPDGDAVALRSEEENIGDGMPARVRLSLSYLTSALGSDGVEVRLHNTTLYNSIYRGDNTMFVNAHVYGSAAAQSPVLHLQRVPGGRLFDHYQTSFEKVWDSATPYLPEPPKAKRRNREKVS